MKGDPVRILIAWADDASPNLGVRALGRGSVDLLRRVWPGAEFVMMNYGQRPQQIPWGRSRSLLRERVTGRAGMMEWLAGFDIFWDTRSGDSFADIYGLPRHLTMSLVHEFAVQAGATAMLAPQTIGPFHGTRARMLARRTLSRSSMVFARDRLSAAASERLGRTPDALTTDLVFGIDQPTAAAEHDVLLNVSGLLWQGDAHVDGSAYRDAVHRIIDGLLADGRAVTLLPHVIESDNPDTDVAVSRDLADALDGRVGLHVPRNLDDVRAAIAGSQLVIGARMHACLNALSTGTPAIAMAYSRKFAPLMDSIGWQRVVQIAGNDDLADAVLAHSRAEGLAADATAAQQRGQRLLLPLVDRLGTL